MQKQLVSWFASPDLRDDKAHHEGARILGDLFTCRQRFVEFHFREQPSVHDTLTQGGRELNGQPHVRMSIVQGNHRCSDTDLLQSCLLQHAIGALTHIEVSTPVLECGQNCTFESIPGSKWRKTVPAGGIWLLDGHHSAWSGERHHLAYEVLIPTHGSKDKASMDQIKGLPWQRGVIGILFKDLDVVHPCLLNVELSGG